MEGTIKIRGARENNLKNVSLEIPKYKLVVMTGPSGSGKSTLAMDTRAGVPAAVHGIHGHGVGLGQQAEGGFD